MNQIDMSMDYLILVNNTHKIPADYIHGLDLITMHGYDNEVYSVEKNTAAQFCELQKASAQKGIEILLTSAYRSVERQQEIKDEMLEEYGEDYVRQFVAVPGYSEHYTGLALDFVAKIDNQWLIWKKEIFEHVKELQPIYDLLPQYGFILRYIAGKEEITGYPAEPWHIRYVGDPAIASEIMERGITLEEYLEK